jgi:Malate/L-lactate dehydrogenases
MTDQKTAMPMPAGMPSLDEVLLQSNDMPWRAKSLPGVSEKMLWRDEQGGSSIALIKFDKGASIPQPHLHASNQFMFCLKGKYEYTKTGVTLTAGSFYWNPKAMCTDRRWRTKRRSCSRSTTVRTIPSGRPGMPMTRMPADAGATAGAEAVAIDAQRLTSAVADIFQGRGIAAEDARVVADDLVAADLEGIASHGVMLLPMYIERIVKGSVSARSAGEVVSDRGGAIVIDAHNALGQLTARQAVKLAVARAKEIGLAVVVVRNGFHFGTAGRFARMIAEHNCIGIVLSSTRPLMPAPGGAEALVGNNPIAIALPSAGEFPVEADMALSATAMGKVRLAAAAGSAFRTIGRSMRTDGHDRSRCGDQGHAVAGCGTEGVRPRLCHRSSVRRPLGWRGRRRGPPALWRSRGALSLRALFSWRSMPVTSRWATGLRNGCGIRPRVSGSKRGPGVDRIYAPGELVWATRKGSASVCRLDAQTMKSLVETATRVGLGDFESSLLAAKVS